MKKAKKKVARMRPGSGDAAPTVSASNVNQTDVCLASAPLLDPHVFSCSDDFSAHGHDPNALIILPQDRPPRTEPEKGEGEGEKKMSKRKRRKLEQLQKKHDASARREAVMTELQLYRLDKPSAAAEDGEETSGSQVNQTESCLAAGGALPLLGADQTAKKASAFGALQPLRKGKRKRMEARMERKMALEETARLARERELKERQKAVEARKTEAKERARQAAAARETKAQQEKERKELGAAQAGATQDQPNAEAELKGDSAPAAQQKNVAHPPPKSEDKETKATCPSSPSSASVPSKAASPLASASPASAASSAPSCSSSSAPSPPSASCSSGTSPLPCLPRVVYDPLRATAELHRSSAIEAARLALPAAEVESKFVVFSNQHRHPRREDADEDVVSDDEHAAGLSSLSEEEPDDEAKPSQPGAARPSWRLQEKKKRREKLMKRRRHADVLCVCGETGSGKSTQIPQFFFEAGICYPTLHPASSPPPAPASAPDAPAASPPPARLKLKIGVTQPRRVAAVMVARRVAEEMGTQKLVGYHIRHKSENLGPDCRIKFMTDGVLLREIQRDFLCSEYACIIIDEAHERSVNTDLLIGLLSRAVKLRRAKFESGELQLPPLKLVIMSASLRAKDFTDNANLFCPAPALLSIPAKQFHVTSFFSRRTPDNYVKAAIKKCIQAHCKLPPGSILLFVTGREEVEEVVAALGRWDAWRAEREARRRAAGLPAADGDGDGDGGGDGGEEADAAQAFELSDQEDEEGDDGLSADAEGSSGSDGEDDWAADHCGAARRRERAETQRRGGGAERVAERKATWQMVDSESEAEAETEGPPADGAEAPESALSALFDSFENASEEKRLSRRERRGEGSTVWQGAGGSGMTPRRAKREQEASGAMSGSSKSPWEKGDDPFHSQLTAIPLYAALPPREQLKAFRLPKPHERLVIVATNVAETSVTLPNVRYVIDTGREKRRVFASESAASVGASEASCVSRFQISFITQASALQRAGRAGRVGAGFCYRLYSSSVYEHVFQPSSEPAIMRTPLDSLLLYMANLGISRLSTFPFPSPPPAQALAGARERLVALGVLEPKALPPSPPATSRLRGGELASGRQEDPRPRRGNEEDKCTKLGAKLADLPIPPRYAKMLIFALLKSRQLGPDCLGLCCLLVGALSVGELVAQHARFSRPALESTREKKNEKQKSAKGPAAAGTGLDIDSDDDDEDEDEKAEADTRDTGDQNEPQYPWRDYNNDIDAYLWMCGAYCHAANRGKFCRRFGLNSKKMKDVYLLGNQLASILLPMYTKHAGQAGAQGADREARKALKAKKKHADGGVPQPLVVPLKPQPPTPEVRLALHACVLEGLVDHVAVWTEGSTRADLTGGDRARDLGAPARDGGYSAAELKRGGEQRLAFLHPTSNLARHRPRPLLVAYNFILSTSRPFLRDCMAVDVRALSLCASPLIRPGTFLDIPAPTYDPTRDAVIGWQKPQYAPLSLALPAVETPLPPTHELLYATLACAFLEGKLFHKLASYVSNLLVAPQMALAGARSSSHALREFIRELQRNRIGSRKAFLEKWKESKGFLLSDYIKLQRFADYKTIRELSDLWPPI
ncbi:helicase associated domain (ha2) protein [Besnoitia besnoiti]|uniref:Helicase associated domain (Ha2) protein n=1 Tax=Besnoitia besnoiti TaxID=94643 RepID=A0A2A9LZ02_BESBE|nr:helicase associated domain (ha2) protein [Besnoitia besnoiti]PFH31668.1 helicase associated domain (ha2) protein [Besnoitia besnoiti]